MSDRTSARIFRNLFTHLAELSDERNQEMARRVWQWSQRYNFDPSQMQCDELLVVLGLARKSSKDERYVYLGEEDWNERPSAVSPGSA